jgi:hypothetical protein
MPARLVACRSCARHVRITEGSCCWCGAPLPETPTSAALPPPSGLSRAALFAWSTLGAATLGGLVVGTSTATSACGGTETNQTDAAGDSPDELLGTTFYGGACVGDCSPEVDAGIEAGTEGGADAPPEGSTDTSTDTSITDAPKGG